MTLDDLGCRVAVSRTKLLRSHTSPISDPLAGIDGLPMRCQHRRRSQRVALCLERPVKPSTAMPIDHLRSSYEPAGRPLLDNTGSSGGSSPRCRHATAPVTPNQRPRSATVTSQQPPTRRPPGIRPERKPFSIAFTPTPAISAASAHGIIPEMFASRRSTRRRAYGGLEASSGRPGSASALGRSELPGMRQHPARICTPTRASALI